MRYKMDVWSVPRPLWYSLGIFAVGANLSQIATCFTLSLLPVATIQIVANTQAFWITAFSYLINREMVLKIEIIGIIACFGGVLLMA